MRCNIGVDLGGTNIAVGIVDMAGNLLFKHSVPTDTSKGFKELVAEIANTVEQIISMSGIDRENITGLGMGTPSCINPKTGLLVNANNLGWINVPLQEEMQSHFAFPVHIQNDASCAALGEVIKGAAAEYDDVLMVTLGTGVGGGIIINRKIFNGCDNMGAEIGHTKLVYNGYPCTCGQNGCFESYASATALIRQTKEAAKMHPKSLINKLAQDDGNTIGAKLVFDAAGLGDETARRVVETYIEYLAAGLSTLITIFRPQAIIIGGGIGNQRDALLRPLKEKIIQSTFAARQIGIPELICAKLGNDAGIIGAAMLCR